MGRRVLAAGALSALLLVSIACSVSYETVNGKLPIADPFILLHEGTYYAYGTGGTNGFRVYTSKDLRHWQQGGYALSKENVWGTKQFWAPEVYYVPSLKRFVMFYSSEEHVCVAFGDRPEGPFTQEVQRPLRKEKGIDSSLFIDDDGTPYIFFVRFTDGNVIWAARMEDSLDALREETLTDCFRATEPWELVDAKVVEGPSVFKHGDTYYMMYSANHTRSRDYGVGYATAPSPLGPWTKYPGNPVWKRGIKGVGEMVGTGHGAPFKARSGRRMYVFHAHQNDTTPYPRTTYINNRLRILRDGTLRLDGRVLRPDVRRPVPDKKKPVYTHILLRDFRTVKDGKVVNYNIGTAAHGPSTMAVLKKYLPDDVKITVWADAPLEPSLSRMMERRFPGTEWVFGSLSSSDPDTSALAKAVASSDLFLVSSGSGIAVARSLREYRKRTGKPAAAYAIGYGSAQDSLIRKMDFVWFRDEPSLKRAQGRKTVPALCGWAPDAVFDFDCVDKEGAEAFMKAGGLESGRFICCIPGFRYTPRWEYFGTPVDEKQKGQNEASKLKDNEILCRIITEAVRERGLKVLICAEQIPELRLCKEAVYDVLPEDVRKQCVLQQSWWSPDVALGVYRHSLCVCGIEMHSQVMAVGNGVPAVVFRHSGFGSKSDMWNSIGLGEWLLDIDAPDAADRACEIVGSILDDPKAAARKVKNARRIIDAAEKAAVERSFFR